VKRQQPAGHLLAECRDRSLAIGGEGGRPCHRDRLDSSRRRMVVGETTSHGLVHPQRAIEVLDAQGPEIAQLDLSQRVALVLQQLTVG
jgi:hypothetical protein